MKNNLSLIAASIMTLGLTGCASQGLQAGSMNDNFEKIQTEKSELKEQKELKKKSELKTSVEQNLNRFIVKPNLSLNWGDVAKKNRISILTAMPAEAFFQIVTENTPINLMLDASVQNEIVNMNVRNLNVEEIFKILKNQYGYEFNLEGNVLHVSKPKYVEKTIIVSYNIGKRTGQSDLSVTSSSTPQSTPQAGATATTGATTTPTTPLTGQTGQSGAGNSGSKVSTTETTDFWVNLNSSLGGMIDTKTDTNKRLVINEQSGMIYLKGDFKEVASVEKYLKKMDNLVSQQVLIEAKIINVKLTTESQQGINWSKFGKNGSIGFVTPGSKVGTTGDLSMPVSISQAGTNITTNIGSKFMSVAGAVSGNPLAAAFQVGNFAAMISLLESEGRVSVLSNPRTIALQNVKSILKEGETQQFIGTVTSTTTTSVAGSQSTPNITKESYFKGVVLDVTPVVREDGRIQMRIHTELTNPVKKIDSIDTGSGNSTQIPLVDQQLKQLDNMAIIDDGNIVAIGGLITEERDGTTSKVPGVGDVPVAGWLAKSRDNTINKSEYVVLIKPTIIKSSEDTDKLDDAMFKRLKDLVNAK